MPVPAPVYPPVINKIVFYKLFMKKNLIIFNLSEEAVVTEYSVIN